MELLQKTRHWKQREKSVVTPWDVGVKRLTDLEEWGGPGDMEVAQGNAESVREWTLAAM